jgi:alcohol dehydrogenase
MKAWRLNGLGGPLTFEDVPLPTLRPHSVLIRMEAVPLLSYLKDYVAGKLPTYSAPAGKFTPGTNGVGIIDAVGGEVWQLKVGQRVIVSPHFIAPENVDEPAQILIGLTSMGPDSAPLQADWPDGTLAEFALAPVSTVTPVEGLDDIAPAQIALLNRAIVPYGGLKRGRLAAGERLVVNGASGAYGTAAVLLGLAMGATRAVAAGRNAAALEALAKAAGPRVVAVQLTGNVTADAAKLREACGGGAEISFDIVGRAGDPNATLAALKSLHRGGRLVLMGSMTTALPLSYGDVIRNNWEIIGQFMYPAGAYRSLLGLVRAKLLDLSPVRALRFPLAALTAAMDAATNATNLECVVVEP